MYILYRKLYFNNHIGIKKVGNSYYSYFFQYFDINSYIDKQHATLFNQNLI